jgi:HlyD family secretion protein
MKKKVIISIVLVILLTGLLETTACSGLGGTNGGVTQQQVTVTRGDLTLSVSGDGKITTSREARLTFSSAGRVSKIAVHEGDKVKTGDVLASLDTRSLELALQQVQMSVTQAEGTLLQAQLAQRNAENTLENLKNSGDSLKLALINAQVSRDTAKINLNTGIAAVDFTAADAALNRAKTYYEYVQNQLKTATTNIDTWLMALDSAKQSLDAAQAAYNNALAGYDSNQVNLKKEQLQAAELSVTLAQKNMDDLGKNVAIQEMQVASSAQTVKQAQQAVDLAKQSLADAQRQLDEANITAPFDGVVAAVLVKEGDIIPTPSMVPTTVIQLVNPGFLELVVEVDEIDIPSVKLAQEAAVKVEALPGAVFKGKVTAIYPVPLEKGGIVLYDVKLGLDVPESSGIKVGMSATADILTEKRTNVLMVPSRAVTKKSQGQTVVKVKVDKSIEERAVIVGLDDGIRTEIVSGLVEGQTVIVETKAKSSSAASLFGG